MFLTDWSLITGRGAIKRGGGGGHVKFDLYKKGTENALAMLKLGTKVLGSFLRSSLTF